MKDPRQNEERKGPSLGTVLKGGVALALGGAGIKYRKEITGYAKEKTGRAILSAHSIRDLPETQRFIDDFGTFAKSMKETVGTDPGIRGFSRMLRNKGNMQKNYTQHYRNNVAARRHQTYGDNPSAIQRLNKFDAGYDGIVKYAKEATRDEFMKEMLQESAYIQAFGEKNAQALKGLFLEQRSMLNIREQKSRDYRIKKFTMDYDSKNQNAKKQNYQLTFGNDAAREDFEKNLHTFLDDLSARMRKEIYQMKDTKNILTPTNNRIENKVRGMRAVGFHELRLKNKREADTSWLSTIMKEQGYMPIDVGYAEKNNLHERFKVYKRQGDTQEASNYIHSYKKHARALGLKDKDIEKDILLTDVFYHKDTGEILDLSKWKRDAEMFIDINQQGLQVPFLNFNLFDLFQTNTVRNMRNAPATEFFRAGEVKPYLQAHGGKTIDENYYVQNKGASTKPLEKSYYMAGTNVYDVEAFSSLSNSASWQEIIENAQKNIVMDDAVLASQEFGITKRMTEDHAGLSSRGPRNKFQKIFGFGQEHESLFERTWRAITKFDKEDYGGNLASSIVSSTNMEDQIRLFQHGYRNAYENTRNLSAEASNYMHKHIDRALQYEYGRGGYSTGKVVNLSLSEAKHEEDILNLMNIIANTKHESRNMPFGYKGSEFDQLAIENTIEMMFKKNYLQDSDLFYTQKRMLKDKDIITGEMWSLLAMREPRGVDSFSDATRSIEELGLNLLSQGRIPGGSNQNQLYRIVEEGLQSGELTKRSAEEILNLHALGRMEKYNQGFKEASSIEDVKNVSAMFNKELQDDPTLLKEMNLAFKKADPWYSTGPGEEYDEKLNTISKYTPMKRHRGLLESINQELVYAADPVEQGIAVAGGVGRWMEQFFAGRNNMDKVTTSTMYTHFFTSRLDDAVSSVGLGLPIELRGSAQSILFNQWGRRIVLPYMLYQQAVYFDGLTGDTVSDNLADMYVNMHKDLSGIKEFTGINRIITSLKEITPGYDQWGDMPGLQQFNFLTMGLLSDDRSREEVNQYYESGEDAIRKGRYWGVGSGTPWSGGKINEYRPNWYRRVKSDFRFAENVSGSEEEYWENNWMPTLTNPLAPIRHFITDPYHYEDKYRDSRPYAITGGFSELQQIPLIGPVVDSVVSGILKPQREHRGLEKSHRAYLEMYNERLTSAYLSANGSAVIEGSPGGSVSMRQADIAYSEDFGDEEGLEEYNDPSGRLRYLSSLSGGSGGVGMGGIGGRGSGNGPGYGSGYTIETLSQMNATLSSGANVGRTQDISNMNSLHDPMILTDLNDAINLNSLTSWNGAWRDSFYNMSETAGIFGFLYKTGVNFQESGRGNILQDSESANSYNRAFWDMELGGLGGDISEIFRRYVARDPNRHYYNPIRNSSMPGWMPGPEYFTDFLHGDPYSRIANGFMRLPGEAYERLYNVKKDEYGNYSAFDRYRILADVAPYSEQYRMAKKEVSLLNQNGLLSESQIDEYREIREQVTEKKKKKRFYERRFTNADVNMEEVTVTKIIDQNTFLTREYGNNPIKLAGINVKSDDESSIELIRQMIVEGQKLKIATDKDPLRKVRNDSVDSIRAVVYTPRSEDGSLFGMTGIGAGENLNYVLAHRGGGAYGDNQVTIKDDGSATSTVALYGKDQITVGKLNESIVHSILPQLPVVGVFADKFLQVRSPLESYKRELYGKAWRSWDSPIDGWLIPAVQTITERNPIVAAAEGYGLGLLAGRNGRSWLGLGMGLTAGALASLRVLHDVGNEVLPNGRTWIPKRREEERDLEDYFDRLKYIKYRGLYEKTKELAKTHEGFDLDQYLEESSLKGRQNKGLKRFLENQKKWLKLDYKSGEINEDWAKEELKGIRADLKALDADRASSEIGPYTALALRYKETYESTLYGADESGDFRAIYRGLPAKDREYFTAFLEAAPEEREEILRLLPTNQRRIFQQKWGMTQDKKESMTSFFSRHNLPDLSWEGWDPRVSLDSIKVKTMENLGMELTEANYWDDDVMRAEAEKAKAIDIKRGGLMSRSIDTRQLEKVLSGAGLRDVRVTMMASQGDNSSFRTELFLEQDRKDELVSAINQNIYNLFS